MSPPPGFTICTKYHLLSSFFLKPLLRDSSRDIFELLISLSRNYTRACNYRVDFFSLRLLSARATWVSYILNGAQGRSFVPIKGTKGVSVARGTCRIDPRATHLGQGNGIEVIIVFVNFAKPARVVFLLNFSHSPGTCNNLFTYHDRLPCGKLHLLEYNTYRAEYYGEL